MGQGRPYYVPDTYIKTYTSGRLRGAPRCKSTGGNTPAPAPAPAAGLPDPQGGYGSYSQTYELGKRFKGWSYRELSRELTHHFTRYFAFPGCGARIRVGKRCTLRVNNAPDGPVRFTAITGYGIALKSLPGHPEGAGRTITFRWARYCSPASDYLYCDHTYLKVDAWGPVSRGSILGPLNAETVARYAWTKFSGNIRAKYPRCPSGKAWVKSQEGVLHDRLDEVPAAVAPGVSGRSRRARCCAARGCRTRR